MPSFSDSIFLFILALLLFGPKKLPVLARELGKWVGEFRRASNEFKMQMEEELRLSEQEDRRKQIAAMEAAAPLPQPVDEPEHPHLRPVEGSAADTAGLEPAGLDTEASHPEASHPEASNGETSKGETSEWAAPSVHPAEAEPGEPPPDRSIHASEREPAAVAPLPIATAGDLRMMPPATGLPVAHARAGHENGGAPPADSNAPNDSSAGALSTLVSSIPRQQDVGASEALVNAGEGAAHSH